MRKIIFFNLLICVVAISLILGLHIRALNDDEKIHEHSFEQEWTMDEAQHWHNCDGCEETTDRLDHEWNNGYLTTAPSQFKEGEMTYTCNVCGRVKKESVPRHTAHTYETEWSMNGTEHWHDPSCGCINVYSSKGTHTYKNDTCTVCGYVNVDFSDFMFKECTGGYTVLLCTTDSAYVTIPATYNGKKVVAISDYAFADNTNIVSITLSKNIKDIGKDAFDGCYRLTEIVNLSTLPIEAGESSYGKIALNAFSVVSAVKDTKIKEAGGFMFIKHNGVNYLLGNNSDRSSYTLPSSFNSESYVVRDYAFYRNDEIINIASTCKITRIGDYAFYGCFNMNNLSLSENITEIGKGAFMYCDSIKSVVIPDSVKKIGELAFAYSTGIENAHVGNGINEIPVAMFSGCKNLSNISMSNDVYCINDYAFSGCASIKEITLPDSLINIGANAFSSCESMHSVIIPNKVEFIGKSAFRDCSSLLCVSLGEGVLTISDHAFDGCNKLVEVINHSSLEIKRGSTKHGGISYVALTISKEGSRLVSEDGLIFMCCNDYTYLVSYIGDKSEIVIPSTYKGVNYVINKFAFATYPDTLERIIFADVDGWYTATHVASTTGKEIKSSTIEKSALKYLSSVCENYFWKQ